MTQGRLEAGVSMTREPDLSRQLGPSGQFNTGTHASFRVAVPAHQPDRNATMNEADAASAAKVRTWFQAVQRLE